MEPITFDKLDELGNEWANASEERKSEIEFQLMEVGIKTERTENGNLKLDIPVTFMLGLY